MAGDPMVDGAMGRGGATPGPRGVPHA